MPNPDPMPIPDPTPGQPDAPPAANCGTGYVTIPGTPPASTYRLYEYFGETGTDDREDWWAASAICTSAGAHLVVFGSQQEADAIEAAIDDVVSSSPYIWVGVSDDANEGQWLTVLGGPPPWTHWWPGQPNNEEYYHDCMIHDQGYHFDWSCYSSYPFACECE
jgi:hypothetical protein